MVPIPSLLAFSVVDAHTASTCKGALEEDAREVKSISNRFMNFTQSPGLDTLKEFVVTGMLAWQKDDKFLSRLFKLMLGTSFQYELPHLINEGVSSFRKLVLKTA